MGNPRPGGYGILAHQRDQNWLARTPSFHDLNYGKGRKTPSLFYKKREKSQKSVCHNENWKLIHFSHKFIVYKVISSWKGLMWAHLSNKHSLRMPYFFMLIPRSLIYGNNSWVSLVVLRETHAPMTTVSLLTSVIRIGSPALRVFMTLTMGRVGRHQASFTKRGRKAKKLFAVMKVENLFIFRTNSLLTK